MQICDLMILISLSSIIIELSINWSLCGELYLLVIVRAIGFLVGVLLDDWDHIFRLLGCSVGQGGEGQNASNDKLLMRSLVNPRVLVVNFIWDHLLVTSPNELWPCQVLEVKHYSHCTFHWHQKPSKGQTHILTSLRDVLVAIALIASLRPLSFVTYDFHFEALRVVRSCRVKTIGNYAMNFTGVAVFIRPGRCLTLTKILVFNCIVQEYKIENITFQLFTLVAHHTASHFLHIQKISVWDVHKIRSIVLAIESKASCYPLLGAACLPQHCSSIHAKSWSININHNCNWWLVESDWNIFHTLATGFCLTIGIQHNWVNN